MKRYNIQQRRGRGRTLSIEEQYSRYVEQFTKRAEKLLAKGITPAIYKSQLDNKGISSLEDFSLALRQKKRSGVSTTNIVREIVSSQLYEFTREEASSIKGELRGLYEEVYSDKSPEEIEAMLKKYTFSEIRTNKAILSELNDLLKATGYSSGTERADYIGYYIYDSK